MINDHQVRERAYFIWEDEGCGFGQAEAHWLRAETELKATAAEPLTVQPVAAAASLSASPAKTLKTLKTPASRAKAPAKISAKAPKATAPKAAIRAKKPAAIGAAAIH